MIETVKLRKVGDSLVITMPAEIVLKMGWEEGQRTTIETDVKRGVVLVCREVDDETRTQATDAHSRCQLSRRK